MYVCVYVRTRARVQRKRRIREYIALASKANGKVWCAALARASARRGISSVGFSSDEMDDGTPYVFVCGACEMSLSRWNPGRGFCADVIFPVRRVILILRVGAVTWEDRFGRILGVWLLVLVVIGGFGG